MDFLGFPCALDEFWWRRTQESYHLGKAYVATGRPAGNIGPTKQILSFHKHPYLSLALVYSDDKIGSRIVITNVPKFQMSALYV